MMSHVERTQSNCRPSAFQARHIPSWRDPASVMRCRRSLPLAVGRCCCCHRCCQPGGPDRLRPGPWFQAGVSAVVSGVKRDFA